MSSKKETPLEEKIRHLDNRMRKVEVHNSLIKGGWRQGYNSWYPPKWLAKVFNFDTGYTLDTAKEIANLSFYYNKDSH